MERGRHQYGWTLAAVLLKKACNPDELPEDGEPVAAGSAKLTREDVRAIAFVLARVVRNGRDPHTMKNRSISLKAELDSRVGAANLLVAPGDAVLITRGQPRWLLLRCPCGCGEEMPVNLDARAGKAWRLYRRPHSGLTLFPSVWRDTGCESHFVI